VTTFKELVDEVVIRVSGYTQRQDQATYLMQAVTDTPASSTYSTADPYYQIKVQDGTSLSRGMIEVDDELIWIDNFDQVNNIGYVSPDGRGYRGTYIAQHDSGARVTINPSYPRSVVQKEINNAITGVYPDLFGVYYTTFPFIAARNTYPLPSEALNVLACSWQTIGPSKEWLPVRKWRIDKTANIAAFNTARTVSLYDGIVPGRTVQVIYSKKPTELLLDSDDYTASGLDESTRETIILGASYRITAFLDTPRVTGMSVEADALDQSNPSGAGTQVSRYLFAQYKERLLVEIRRQEELYPPRVHYTR